MSTPETSDPLFVFNGDCLLNAWKQAGNSGDTLVWRESCLEGTFPAPDATPEELFRHRAKELNRVVVPEISAERLCAAFERDHAKLCSAKRIELWFDYCICDMTMLAELFYLLEHQQAGITLVLLDYRGKDFSALPQQRIAADSAVRTLYAGLWRAICAGGAAIRHFAASCKTFPFPGFETALRRYTEEFPAGGLTRTEREIMAILTEKGHSSGAELFSSLFTVEEMPFLGDTMCDRLLQSMVERRLLGRENGCYFVTK